MAYGFMMEDKSLSVHILAALWNGQMNGQDVKAWSASSHQLQGPEFIFVDIQSF